MSEPPTPTPPLPSPQMQSPLSLNYARPQADTRGERSGQMIGFVGGIFTGPFLLGFSIYVLTTAFRQTGFSIAIFAYLIATAICIGRAATRPFGLGMLTGPMLIVSVFLIICGVALSH